MAEHSASSKPKCDPIHLKVLHPGETPPCVLEGRLLCRGCPGWVFMKQAVLEPDSMWGRYPIHCAATGLTMIREP